MCAPMLLSPPRIWEFHPVRQRRAPLCCRESRYGFGTVHLGVHLPSAAVGRKVTTRHTGLYSVCGGLTANELLAFLSG